MGDKDVVLLLAVVMIFFATLFISKNQAVANASVPTAFISNIEVISQIEAEADAEAEAKIKAEAEIQYQQFLLERQVEIEEELQNQIELEDLEKAIKTLVGENTSNFGMVYYDLNSNKSIEINEDKQFVAASTVKIPINMLIYDMVQDNKIDIDDKLKYIKADYEDGAGILRGMDLSEPLDIKKLSDYSIMYSDNIAINMLLRKAGNENRYAFIEEVVGQPIEHNGNYTTPMNSFKILERLYLNPEENEYYNGIVETMKKTQSHDRIDKYIPQEIVAHKIGDYAGYVNDMAIVCTENPYILTVFTNNMPDSMETIAQVSKLIYDAQIK
jgi:beta-lactamase class A